MIAKLVGTRRRYTRIHKASDEVWHSFGRF